MIVEQPMPKDPRFEDLTGKKFDRLKVSRYYGAATTASGKHHHYWLCVCKCGNSVKATGGNLKRKSGSCGCKAKELSSRRLLKHGHASAKTREYRIWCGMRKRCYDNDNDHYETYGGRGIKVCKRWLDPQNGFNNFLADMGQCPEGLTLERNNTNGNYTPDNCRWATMKEQQRNRRNNNLITHNGKTQCLTAWAEELGINRCTIWSRLANGRSVDEALAK